MASNEEFVDYDEQEQAIEAPQPETKKGSSHVNIHSSGFEDLFLKPEVIQAVVECGFEHPSEVQHQCIPTALSGENLICQAKSGMGKTAVFVLSALSQLEPVDGETHVLVLCHVRELAYQIDREFKRFSKHLPNVRSAVMIGGLPIAQDKEVLANKATHPHVVVGTPGRVALLVKDKALDLRNLKLFVIDECDRLVSDLDMLRDVVSIFKASPVEKQVMMFSATLPKTVREACQRFCKNPREVLIDEDSKLTLHGLQQYFVRLTEAEKNRKLHDLLDDLQFNQVVIFVSKPARAKELSRLLNEHGFPALHIYGQMPQEERLSVFQRFKNDESRILVATDIFGRGIDIERVNIVINYDFPTDTDQYLHRVGRAGRFATKGLAISFVSSDESSEDSKLLQAVQDRFEAAMSEVPERIAAETYMNTTTSTSSNGAGAGSA